MASRQRAVGHQGNAHLPADGDQFPLILAVQQVVVVLHGGERSPTVVPGRQLHIVELILYIGENSMTCFINIIIALVITAVVTAVVTWALSLKFEKKENA